MIPRKKGSLKRLIDHLPVVVFEYTFFPDGRRDFTYISPRSEDLLGVNPNELMRGHLRLSDFIHPDDWTSFNESVVESVKEMKDWKWEGKCKGKDGFIWLSSKGIPVCMRDGRIVYNGVFEDITDQKKLQQQQIDTEQRYRELVEQLPLGIVIHAKGKILLANAAAARIIGAGKADDLIGINPIQFLHPDSLEIVKERIRMILGGKGVPPLEEKFIRLDGRIIHVESSGQLYWYLGEPAVQVIFTDITERKKTEASFQKTEKLFYQLFQNTPLAVTLLNEEGLVVQINKGFAEMFGYTETELKGKSLNQFIVPNNLETEGNDLNSLISSNRIVRMETIRYRKDKTMVSVIIYGVPVLLQDKTIGIFGMYVDITEQKKVEEELQIRNTELDNFVYKVSHDLRAPLSSILGLAHLAGIPGNDDNLNDYIKLMGEKAMQLDHFISDVLSHSKNLKLELKVGEVDLQKVINQTFNELSYLPGAEHVKKEISVSGTGFYSDPWRIAEIFRNLVSNSIKYRKLDGTIPIIHLKAEVTEYLCCIDFRDNGIGIEESSRTKIFEMFYRASNQSEGSGLGLYIVKNAIEKLGGKISVETELNQGTLFKITIPNLRLSK